MKRDREKGLSLFYRLLLAFLGTVIIISGLLTVISYIFSKRSLEKHTQERITQEFVNLSHEFEDELKTSLIRELQLLASNPVLDEFMMSSHIERDINARSLERLFLQAIHYTSSYKSISFTDYSGKEIVKADRSGRSKDYRDFGETEQFKQIESGAPGSVYTEGPYTDHNGNEFFSIGINKADVDIGEFGGAVIIEHSLDGFFKYLKTIKIFGQNPVWIFSPDGEVLRQPIEKKALFDPRPHLSEGFHDVPLLRIYDTGMLVYQDLSIIPEKPLLRVAISIPSSLLLKDVRSALRFFLIVFLISIFLISLIAFYLSGYLTKPIVKLADAAASLAKGDLSTQVKIKTSGEVQMLVESFNQMAEDLKKTTVSKDYVDNIIMSMIDTLIVVSPEGSIIRVNDSACSLLGYEEKDLLGKQFNMLFGEELLFNITNIPDEFQKDFVSNVETVYVSKQGRKIPVLFSASVMHESNGRVQGIVCVAQDMSQRKYAEDKIRHLAYYDSLTGLPNRTFFIELLRRAVSYAHRHGRMFAVLFADLDNFKRINDTLGHYKGDLLLQAVSKRLLNTVRNSDYVARSGEDILEPVSRMGGDEFIILLHELNAAEDAARVAKRIMNDMKVPFNLEGQEVFISFSIGISLYPLDGIGVERLLKNADIAMYYAKDQGRDNYQFYTELLNATSLERLNLENELRKALERKEFLIYYQPILSVHDKKVISVEALVRWQHHEKGIVSPADFIPLAEETGLIVPIGEWVLRNACIQCKEWHKAGLGSLSVAVNLSSRQFEDEKLIEKVMQALHDADLEAQYLVLEITESTVIKDPEKAIAILSELRVNGITVAIDDFGSGYSSLNYLRQIPFDSLKIDRVFIMSSTKSSDDMAIVKAIITLAHSLRLKVIAEGVETEEQLEFLCDEGCDEMQGFLFKPPLPPEEIPNLLSQESS